MIGKLKGIIDSYGEDSVILDVNGVGYLVHCSARTLQALPAAGEPVALAIETHVREDQIRLFGFHSDGERATMALSRSAMAEARSAGFKVPRIESATLVPTPCTVCSKRNHSRSPSE